MSTTPNREAAQRLLGLDPAPTYRPVDVQRRSAPSCGDAGEVGCEHLTLVTDQGTSIPCLFLTPKRPWRTAVVAVHQHAGDFRLGKSEVAGLSGDPALAYGRRLARAGAAVLVPDLLGFEERQRGWSPEADRDEQLDAFHRVALGSSLQAQHTRDVAVATSWLFEHVGPDVRLGVMGHSLGGQVALFSMALDPRLEVGVISCGAGTVASLVRERITHNPAWFVPGLIAAGDVSGVAATLRGQRVLLSAGEADRLFPVDGVRDVVASFPPGVCTPVFFDGGHELPEEVMARACLFLAAG